MSEFIDAMINSPISMFLLSMLVITIHSTVLNARIKKLQDRVKKLEDLANRR